MEEQVMEINKIYNEDCYNTMQNNIEPYSIDLILTSPPYNTSRKGSSLTNACANIRYDEYNDAMGDDEYIQWTLELFNKFDSVIKKNGSILYNMSYSSENTWLMWNVISQIQINTNWVIADCIVWKKPSTSPNSCSMNKLTRIVEYVFVFCRKDEFMSFYCNKGISSKRATGQIAYKNIFNIIEAPNNDGVCDIHKATFSSLLCLKLMNLYLPSKGIVYDPFMGTGTTAIAAIKFKANYLGSEISERYCKYAEKRIKQEKQQLTLF